MYELFKNPQDERCIFTEYGIYMEGSQRHLVLPYEEINRIGVIQRRHPDTAVQTYLLGILMENRYESYVEFPLATGDEILMRRAILAIIHRTQFFSKE